MKHLLIVEDGKIILSAPIDKFAVSVSDNTATLTAKLQIVTKGKDTQTQMNPDYVGPV